MADKLTRRYGLLTSICLVVGTVIGSGIFFRNEPIFRAIGGNMWIGVAAWIVGGLIALSLTYALGILSTQHEEIDGLTGLAEVLVGEKYAYVFGWFMATMLFPTLVGVLSWISGRFTVELLGLEADLFFSGQTYLFALFYLVAIYVMNALAPKLAEKFHISCTFIKVVPLILMGIVGLAVGLSNGTTVANLSSTYVPVVEGNPFFIALISTAFAYLGWEVVISLSKEIINVKRNLPIALVVGMLIIIAVYVLYFVGLFSAASVEELTSGGVRVAFTNVFSEVGGTVLFVFIIISCLGTLNGLTTALGRSFYALAAKKQGPNQELLSQVDKASGMPNNSMALGLLFVAFWMLVFGGHLAGYFYFPIPDLIPISLMAMLVPILVAMIFKEKKLGFFNRIIAPLIAIAGASYFVFAIVYQQGVTVLYFLIIFTIITVIGLLLKGKMREA